MDRATPGDRGAGQPETALNSPTFSTCAWRKIDDSTPKGPMLIFAARELHPVDGEIHILGSGHIRFGAGAITPDAIWWNGRWLTEKDTMPTHWHPMPATPFTALV